MHFWSFSSKVKPGNVKFRLTFVLDACSLEENGVEEQNCGWDPHILARPANSTLSQIIVKPRKKCVLGRFLVKTKPRNGNFMLMSAQESSIIGKYNHNFIFFHVLPQFRAVGIEVRKTQIWGFTHTLVPEPHLFPQEGASKPNICLKLPILGFILLKTDLKRTFYVILW